jgi:hypothetical protein
MSDNMGEPFPQAMLLLPVIDTSYPTGTPRAILNLFDSTFIISPSGDGRQG